MSCKIMDDIDIFQRTLKCREIGDSKTESEIEIFEVESGDSMIEEEAVLEEEIEDKCDLQGMYDELDCLKRRIQKLLLLMKEGEEPCGSKPEPKIESTCCEKLVICHLQKEQHKLQFQINKLLAAYKAMRKEIHDLHAYNCKQSKEIEQLQLLTLFLQYWQRGLKPDEGVCHQRYVYIKDHKADWTDIKEFLKNEKRCPGKICEEYLLKSTHERNNINLQAELEKLKALFVESFEMNRKSLHDSHYEFPISHPLKEIEIDFIERQFKKYKKLEQKDCQHILKCDKVNF